MQYAVYKWLDQIREKTNYADSNYNYFDTRNTANAFIRGRAESELLEAQAALVKAADRVRRVNKKFA